MTNPVRQYDLRAKAETIADPNVILSKPARVVLYRCQRARMHAAGEGKPVFVVEEARWVDWFLPNGRYVCRTRPTRYAQ